eukprot:scaffold6355_cov119-Cylindrotheca_fusiformis.AAC.10
MAVRRKSPKFIPPWRTQLGGIFQTLMLGSSSIIDSRLSLDNESSRGNIYRCQRNTGRFRINNLADARHVLFLALFGSDAWITASQCLHHWKQPLFPMLVTVYQPPLIPTDSIEHSWG